MDAISAGILAKKLSGLNELHNENKSLDATIVAAAGDFNTITTFRSWARARERLKVQRADLEKDTRGGNGETSGQRALDFEACPHRRTGITHDMAAGVSPAS
jgi:hypothetical protein